MCSPVAAEDLGVVALPGRTARWARLVEAVALAKLAGAATSSSLATELAVSVLGVTDPVDARVAADGFVERIDHYDFVVLVDGVLVDPVGIKDTKVAKRATGTLFSDGAEVASELDLVNALVSRFAVNVAFGFGLLAGATTHTDTVHKEALLAAVAHASCFVGADWLGNAADARFLAVLPHAHALQEAQHIRLLLLPQQLHVFVRLRKRNSSRRSSVVFQLITGRVY